MRDEAGGPEDMKRDGSNDDIRIPSVDELCKKEPDGEFVQGRKKSWNHNFHHSAKQLLIFPSPVTMIPITYIYTCSQQSP